MIVSLAIENNLVYLRHILVGSVIVIVSWAVWNRTHRIIMCLNYLMNMSIESLSSLGFITRDHFI